MCFTKPILVHPGRPGSLEEAIVLAVVRAGQPRSIQIVFHSSPMPVVWLGDDAEGIVGWVTACRLIGRSLIPTGAHAAARVDGALEMLQSLVQYTRDSNYEGSSPSAASYVQDARRRFGQRAAPRTLGDVCWDAAATWAQL
jgi:hypothetical protein